MGRMSKNRIGSTSFLPEPLKAGAMTPRMLRERPLRLELLVALLPALASLPALAREHRIAKQKSCP
jgi:hypothetical protein